MRHSQGHFSYNAAKGATVHLSKLMSAEFEKAAIRVNSIAPGYFPSEMTGEAGSQAGAGVKVGAGEEQKQSDKSDDRNKTDLPAEKIKEKGHVPAERAGSDEEMAMAVLFLARNTYVNGEVVAVDGGVLNQVPGR